MKFLNISLLASLALATAQPHGRHHVHEHLHEHALEKRSNATIGASEPTKPWAITYTPYDGNGKDQTWCKTSDEMTADIVAIAQKGFKTVRLYSPDDCKQLGPIHQAAKAHNMSLIVGIFFKSDPESELSSQLSEITDYFKGDYADVALVTVGNECISAGSCQPAALPGYISTAKTTLAAASYTGPVSTALIVSDWQEHAEGLCPVVDVIGAQIHAFFADNAVIPATTGVYFDQQFELAAAACHGQKPTVCTETGWPSAGGAFKAQVASPDNQQAAIASLLKSKYVALTTFFSNTDDLWKYTQAPYEMHFGCLGLF